MCGIVRASRVLSTFIAFIYLIIFTLILGMGLSINSGYLHMLCMGWAVYKHRPPLLTIWPNYFESTKYLLIYKFINLSLLH